MTNNKSDPPKQTTITGGQVGVVGDHAHIEGGIHFHAQVINVGQPVADPSVPATPYRLLSPPHPFVGRQQERERLGEKLRAGGAHLLCGMGGIGKTALALRVAHDLAATAAFPDGILWVPLETAPSPDMAAAWIIAAMGLENDPNPLSALSGLLYARSPLLILDNAEAAPDTADVLLACRGRATVLITSRDTRVGVAAIPGNLDDLAPLDAADAITLLRARLPHLSLSDAQAAAITQLVGGLPLALVLATGFISRRLRRNSTPVETYLALLECTPLKALEMIPDRRDASVRVTFELSWQSLDDTAHRTLAALALVPGDSADTSALAAALETDAETIQQALWTLSDFSLIGCEADEPEPRKLKMDSARVAVRYRLHPLMRAYTREKFGPEEAAVLRGRLRYHYLDYAQQHAVGADHLYCAPLEIERDNVLGAMTWAWDAQDWLQVVAFAEATKGYLRLRGYAHLARERTDWWLHAARHLGDQSTEANALQNLGDVYYSQDEYEEARTSYAKALSIYRAIGDHQGQANALKGLGTTHLLQDDNEQALAYYAEALPIYRAIANRPGEAEVLRRKGMVHYVQDRHREAQACYDEALSIFRAIGDRLGETDTLSNLGDVYRIQYEFGKAQACFAEALSMYRAIGDRQGESGVLWSIGDIHLMRAEYREALACYEQTLSLVRAIGDRIGEANTFWGMGDTHLMQSKFEEAGACLEQALSIYRAIGTQVSEAEALKSLGDMHWMQAEYREARECYEAALPISRSTGSRQDEANALKGLGDVHLCQAEYREAQACYEQALSIYRTIGDRWGEATALRGLGDLALATDCLEDATQLYHQALSINQAIGTRHSWAQTLAQLGHLACRQGNLDSARQYWNDSLELYERIGIPQAATVRAWLQAIPADER
jgi:tetratricopeptide (TPR) repeat protein